MLFIKYKKFASYCIAKEHFMNFRNFVFETTDRILRSFVKIPFRCHTTHYHRIFRPFGDGTIIVSLNARNRVTK